MWQKLLFMSVVNILLSIFLTQNIHAAGKGWWSTQGSKIIDEQGEEVVITGINWGFEVYRQDEKGWLDNSTIANYKSMLLSMNKFGFNTIRFVWRDWQLENDCVFQNINNNNPELEGLSCLEVMDEVIKYASQLNMRIILDHHTLLGSWRKSPKLTENWLKLAKRYKNNPYVIGADLDNEPHHTQVCWGCGNNSDWRLGAERLGNEILKVNPKWLIIVEGILGIDLEVAKQYPIRLSNPKKLVYSTHVYPGMTYGIPFEEVESAWDKKFGYLVNENIAPVLVGEFQLVNLGQMEWFNKLVNYMKNKRISGTVWAWRWGDPKYSDQSWYVLPPIEKNYLTISNDQRKPIMRSWLVKLDPNPGYDTLPEKSADANGDGRVDGEDYLIWLKNFGKNKSGPNNGDFNNDRKVDGLDYIIFVNSFGS